MKYPKNLEKRFTQPDDWQTSFFKNPRTSHKIYYGWGSPKSAMPKGVIILLHGLQEFTEKYYETARFFLDHGYAVILFDWQYQGRSGQLESNPHKRHSSGFDADICDLSGLIESKVKLLFPNLPLHMLAHSAGGNIGLRYLIEHPKDFKTAAFSAPLLGVYGLTKYPDLLIMKLAEFFSLLPNSYVPGGKNFRTRERNSDSKNGIDKFSSDPARSAITNAWYLFDPSLQGGSPTTKWLLESLKSMATLKDTISEIKIPCLFGIAEQDVVVCSQITHDLSKKVSGALILDLKNAKHEILMETDDIRNLFLNSFLEIIKDSNIISKTNHDTVIPPQGGISPKQ